MEIDFANQDLKEVYLNPKASLNHGQIIDKGFRKKIQIVIAAKDEQDLRNLKSLHYEKLKGDRSHQRSIKINKQWRIILERIEEEGRLHLLIIDVEDYH
jgi:proteic killer suppression protein